MFLSAMLARGRYAVKLNLPARTARWLPAFALMAFIFYLSQQSAPLGASPTDAVSNAAHVGVYGALAVCVSWGLTGTSTESPTPFWLIAVLAFSLTVLYGVTDEVHQAFVPGRVASLPDLALDGLGALLALATEGLRRLLRRL